MVNLQNIGSPLFIDLRQEKVLWQRADVNKRRNNWTILGLFEKSDESLPQWIRLLIKYGAIQHANVHATQ